jgi:hypothetical protein
LNITDTAAFVAAQNRTTQAVRSIAVYILYSALFNVIGGVIIGISYASAAGSYSGLAGAAGGLVFGGLILVVGNLIALFKALAELGRSNIANSENVQAAGVTVPQQASASSPNQVVCKNCGELNAWNAFRCTKCDGIVE